MKASDLPIGSVVAYSCGSDSHEVWVKLGGNTLQWYGSHCNRTDTELDEFDIGTSATILRFGETGGCPYCDGPITITDETWSCNRTGQSFDSAGTLQ